MRTEGPTRHILDLPLEVRQTIYQYIFRDAPVVYQVRPTGKTSLLSWFLRTEMPAWLSLTSEPYAIMGVSQQIREEALNELQSHLSVQCEIFKAAANARITVIPLRHGLKNYIRHLHLIVHTEYSFWPTNQMSQLQSVLIESRYPLRIHPKLSSSALRNDRSLAMVKCVKSWHLDLFNEPEIPASPGSWAMLKAMTDSERRFKLTWKGQPNVTWIRDDGVVLMRPNRSMPQAICFDWDTETLIRTEQDDLSHSDG
jgi:hypothetical protein